MSPQQAKDLFSKEFADQIKFVLFVEAGHRLNSLNRPVNAEALLPELNNGTHQVCGINPFIGSTQRLRDFKIRHHFIAFEAVVPLFNEWSPTPAAIELALKLRNDLQETFALFVSRFNGTPTVALQSDMRVHVATRVVFDKLLNSPPRLETFGPSTLNDLISGSVTCAVVWHDDNRNCGDDIEVYDLPQAIPMYALISPKNPAAEKLWKPGATTITVEQLLSCGNDLAVGYPQIQQIERFVEKYLRKSISPHRDQKGMLVQTLINHVRADSKLIGLIPGWTGMCREIKCHYNLVALRVVMPVDGGLHEDPSTPAPVATANTLLRKPANDDSERGDSLMLKMQLLRGKRNHFESVQRYISRLTDLLSRDRPLFNWEVSDSPVPTVEELRGFAKRQKLYYYYLTQGKDDGTLPFTQICKTATLNPLFNEPTRTPASRKSANDKPGPDKSSWNLDIGAPIGRKVDINISHVTLYSQESGKSHTHLRISSPNRPLEVILNHRMKLPIDGIDHDKSICLAGMMVFLTERNVCASSAVLVTNVDLMSPERIKDQLVNEFLRSGIVQSFNQPTEIQSPYEPTDPNELDPMDPNGT